MFKDASREWGVGGWTLLSTTPPTLLLFAARYPTDLRAASVDTNGSGLSTGALELAAYILCAAAVRRRVAFESLLCFTDSESARGALNAGSSPSPAMRPLLAALFEPGEQHLAARVTTKENRWADLASRGDAALVATEAAGLGWHIERAHPLDSEWEPLRRALAAADASG